MLRSGRSSACTATVIKELPQIAPLLAGGELVGVLRVYSTRREAFTEEHRRLIELVGSQVIRNRQKTAIVARDTTEKLRSQLDGLSSRQHFRAFRLAELSAADGSACSVLLVDFHDYLQNQGHSSPDAERVFGCVAGAYSWR